MDSKRKIALAASALAAFTGIILITNQANATSSVPAPSPSISSQNAPLVQTTPSVAPSLGSNETTNNATDGDNIQSGDQSGSDSTDSTNSATDGDNVQSGDQSGSDVQSGDQSGSDVTNATDTESNN
jgi:hypothetical protein